jgi:hypothetical protein
MPSQHALQDSQLNTTHLNDALDSIIKLSAEKQCLVSLTSMIRTFYSPSALNPAHHTYL